MKSHYFFISVLLACSLFFASIDRHIIADDSFAYLEVSEKIYHHSYRAASEITKHPPLYSLLLGPSVLIYGRTLMALHFFPILFFLAIPLCLYFLGRHIFRNNLVAFLCALLYLIFPTNLRHLTTPLTEPICVALILASFLLLEKCRRDLKYLPFFGLVLALLFLTRYETIPLILLEFIYLIVFLIKEKRISRRNVFLIILVIAIFQIPFVVFNLSEGSLVPGRAIHALQLVYHHLANPETRMYPDYPPLRLVGVSYNIYLGGNPLLPVMILGGICFAWYRRSGLLIIASIWCAALYGLIIFYGTNTWILRHLTKVTPFICLFICYLLFEIWNLGLKSSRNILSFFPFVLFLTALILSVLYTSARDYRAFQDDTRYSLERASLLQLSRTNPDIPPVKDWIALKIQKLNVAEETFRAVLGYARKPAYLRKRAEVFELENFYSDFTATDFLQQITRHDPVDRFWKGPGSGRLGILPKFRDGTITLRFRFEKPVCGMEYCDRHIAWTRDDRVTLLFSLDGEEWETWYSDARCYDPITYGTYREFPGENHRTIYLKYYFHAGDARREPLDNGGAALEEMAFSVDFYE